jgi:general nucleoside transport system ATP-binding protein
MKLELRNITKRFGAVLANDHLNISIPSGTIHAVVGENGAGKSTAMRIAYGFYRADSGDIVVDDQVRDIRAPLDAIALGIGMVHQHFMLVRPMTVTENIVLGAEPGSALSLDRREAASTIGRLSEAFKLSVDPDAVVEELSVGQQQRVELLKALYRRAELLILDEPTAVLTPQEVEEFFGILRRMRAQGKTVVIITHKLSEVLAISDNVTIMRDGRVVGDVKTSETTAEQLARLMVGRDVLLGVNKGAASPGDAVLSVRNLSVRGRDGRPRLDSVSLDIRAGEIVGVAGIDGNGQTELIESLAGLTPGGQVSGTVTFARRDVTRLGARARREVGIAHVPEDRHRRGLLLEFSVAENVILGVHYRPPAVRRSGAVLLDETAIRNRAQVVMREFDVRPPNVDLRARMLSGGNQQKLIIGREFELPPVLLLISQPTRGVDIGAIEFIHRKIIALRDAGCAVLLVSAELDEVTALADRLLVLRDGRIAGEVDPRRVTPEEIGLLMTGGRHVSSSVEGRS